MKINDRTNRGWMMKAGLLTLVTGLASGTAAQAQTAVCCLPHGSCYITTWLNCRNVGGLWKENWHSCDPNNCRAGQSSQSQVSIPDGTGNGGPGMPADAFITMPESYAITNVRISVFIQHTYQGDLRLELTHVNTGTTATLVNRPGVSTATPFGFSADNFGVPVSPGPTPPPMFLTFDDTGDGPYAPPPVTNPGINNVVGTYRPLTPLAAFNGENAQGVWRLRATDYAGGDVGSIVSVYLRLEEPMPPSCYANCDSSTGSPRLTSNDFQCFVNKFASNDPYANCDGSTGTPVLTSNDFQCFVDKFAAGCT